MLVAQAIGWALAGAVSAVVWFTLWLVALLVADPSTAWAEHRDVGVYISDASVAAILGALSTLLMWWLKQRRKRDDE